MTARSLSTREVARILGLPDTRVRAFVRFGLCRPQREGRRYAFSFQDLVVLRTAQALTRQDVPAARVRRALLALRAQLPEGRPLSGLRVFADAGRVAVRDGPTAWEPETGQTRFEFDLGELAERVDTLAKEPGASGDDAVLAFERGVELEESDRRAAAQAYGQAIELEPRLVDAYVNLGRLRHEEGDTREAERLYRRALVFAPDDPVVHFNLALVLEDSRGVAPAIEHYQRALALDPDFADAHWNLAALCERVGREADAIRHYHAYKKLTDG